MQINFDFFKTENSFTPAKGRVLISEPFLMDNYFKRSIVLITEHNEEGTVGFVLNKPIHMKAKEVIAEFPDVDVGISLGGPVQTNTLHFIHTMGDIIPGSIRILDHIYWGGDFEVVRKLLESGNLNQDTIRFFLGYSGWQPGQLENELAENVWIVAEIPSQEIMMPMTKMFWSRTLKRLGKKFQLWANFPENPQLN